MPFLKVSSIRYLVLCIRNTKYKILNTKYRKGFSLIELLVARHPKPWRRKAIHGFSLIELLVVITIISILIGAGTVSYTNAQQKGRDGKRKSDLKAIQQALEVFFQQNKAYPPDWGGARWCNTFYPNEGWSDSRVKTALEAGYIQKVPIDPLYDGTRKNYFYDRKNAHEYELVAVLENTNDPEYATYTNDCSSETYNYKLAQP